MTELESGSAVKNTQLFLQRVCVRVYQFPSPISGHSQLSVILHF